MRLEIPEFGSSFVVVVGDLMLDRYWHGDTSRISPEAPVPVVRVGDAEERAGGAGNVALNIAALGGGVCVLGITGEDEAGSALQHILEQAGVTCCFDRIPSHPTVTKLRVLSRHQQLIRLDFEGGFDDYDFTGLLTRFEEQLERAGAVVCSDYGKGTLRHIERFIAAARARGVAVLVDPKGNDFTPYRGASVITPNLAEFEAVVGACPSDEAVEERGTHLIEELDLGGLLVTRSERGMTLLERGQAPLHLPTHAREVFDVTGAGDTVISVLAAALAAGRPMREATALSNLAAGIVVSKLGTASVTVPELRRALRDEQEIETGVVSEDTLLQLMDEARAHGERVVMTNGCFDILHPGHIAYLQQAARLGDRLVVAVNDDASVRRLKGEGRPINSVARRMAVLAGLEAVDWVVPFGEDTPERVICRVLPDVLVKGGDYRPEDIAGGSCVLKSGGEVQVLDYVEGHSTSEIINNILEH